jgi:hypothetical protein
VRLSSSVLMKQAKLTDFSPDPKNANRGTDRGRQLLRNSLSKLKAGRSLLADKHGVLIAGNKTRDAALAAGLEDAIVIQTDGSQVVIVQRTDLDLTTDPEAKELAIADNRIGELDLEWDIERLAELNTEIDLSALWDESEWEGIAPDLDKDPPGAGDDDTPYQNKFAVAVECDSEAHQEDVYNRLIAQGFKCKVLTL